jgi:hypothetical protein
MADLLFTAVSLRAAGCVPDAVLVLRDAKGNTLCRLRAVKAILAAWSPVLRGALELSCSQEQQQQQRDGHSMSIPSSSGTHGALMHSGSSGCLTSHSHQAAAAAGSSGAGLGCGSGTGASAYVTSTGTSGGADAVPEYGAPPAAAGSAVIGGGSAGVGHAGMVELPVLVRRWLA